MLGLILCGFASGGSLPHYLSGGDRRSTVFSCPKCRVKKSGTFGKNKTVSERDPVKRLLKYNTNVRLASFRTSV